MRKLSHRLSTQQYFMGVPKRRSRNCVSIRVIRGEYLRTNLRGSPFLLGFPMYVYFFTKFYKKNKQGK